MAWFRLWLALFIVFVVLSAVGAVAIYLLVSFVNWQWEPNPLAQLTAAHIRGAVIVILGVPTLLSVCVE